MLIFETVFGTVVEIGKNKVLCLTVFGFYKCEHSSAGFDFESFCVAIRGLGDSDSRFLHQIIHV